MTSSSWEEYLANQIKEAGFPEPTREYRFAPPRRFRFDFAWPDIKFAVECEGGVYSGGRHVTGAGFTKDAEKYSLAAIEGYKIIRATSAQISSGDCLEWIKAYFEKQEGIVCGK